jgi:hypothetical protein
MSTIWGVEAELKRKEDVLVTMFRNSADVDDYVIESFADTLQERYGAIFDRESFIEKCKETETCKAWREIDDEIGLIEVCRAHSSACVGCCGQKSRCEHTEDRKQYETIKV